MPYVQKLLKENCIKISSKKSFCRVKYFNGLKHNCEQCTLIKNVHHNRKKMKEDKSLFTVIVMHIQKMLRYPPPFQFKNKSN